MGKPEIFKYTWTADHLSYEIYYNKILISGLCSNIHLFKKEQYLLLRIKHSNDAKKELIKILKQKKLWQNKTEEATTSTKTLKTI
jgi:hypothetical protein